MFFDEELPRKKEVLEPRKLEHLSMAELGEYITWLEQEIARTGQEIERKKSAAQAAAGFFKHTTE